MIAERQETYQNAKETARRIADESFSNHVLTPRGEGEWLCARRRTGYYSFVAIVRPGAVIVYGDIGEGIFRGGEAGDTLGWLRSAVTSPEYLLEKLRTKPERTFYPDDALNCVSEGMDDQSELYRGIYEEAEHLHRNGELNAHTWPELVYSQSGDIELCGVGFGYGSGELWLVEALRCFIRLLGEVEQ